jgi:hypothetical protein
MGIGGGVARAETQPVRAPDEPPGTRRVWPVGRSTRHSWANYILAEMQSPTLANRETAGSLAKYRLHLPSEHALNTIRRHSETRPARTGISHRLAVRRMRLPCGPHTLLI